MTKVYFVLLGSIILLLITGCMAQAVQKETENSNKKDKTIVNPKYRVVTELGDLLSTLSQRDTPGYVVMFCGQPKKSNTTCDAIKEAFSQLGSDFPQLE